LKIEILFLSRGGQGAVTASRILASTLVEEGLYAQAIPEFGAERRGAVVKTYIRASTQPIKTHEMIKNPDLIVVFSRGILDIIDLKIFIGDKNPVFLINSSTPVKTGFKTFVVDATGIAIKTGLVVAGWPVINTALLGSLSKVTGLYRLETLIKILGVFFKGELLEKNIEAVKKAYEQTYEATEI
jgi:pyruvate ferredoxin oxidoreductase gamma subunit